MQNSAPASPPAMTMVAFRPDFCQVVHQLNCTARPDRGSSSNEPLSSPCVLLKLLRRGVGVAHTRLARGRCFRAQRRRPAAFVEQRLPRGLVEHPAAQHHGPSLLQVADAVARIDAEQQQVGPKSGAICPRQ